MLTDAWKTAYNGHFLPVDTVLVSGLNDIKPIVKDILYHNNTLSGDNLNQKAAEKFMVKVNNLWNTIKHHSVNNTLSVCYLLHVPALYWHEEDGNFPNQNYYNYRNIIDTINLKIKLFNINLGSSYTPELQGMGEKISRNGQKKYCWEKFREKEQQHMMHLNDYIRYR